MEINSLVKILEDKLKRNITVNNLKIEDKSFLHKKHKNFSQGKFHIRLTIDCEELKQINSIEANRKIHNILKSEINTSIHSLQIIIV